MAEDPAVSVLKDTTKKSPPNAPKSPSGEDDQSYIGSSANVSSDKDSLDNMSLVSNSELTALEDDAATYDDGYDTDTTDNTSPKRLR